MGIQERLQADDESAAIQAEEFLSRPRSERRVIVPVTPARGLAIEAALKQAGDSPGHVVGEPTFGGAAGSAAAAASATAVTGAVAGAVVAAPSAAFSGPIGPGAAAVVGGLLGAPAGIAGYYWAKRRNRRNPPPKGVTYIYNSTARHLNLWQSREPENNVAYVCHPMKDQYIPADSIDAVLLSDKIREAHDLFIVLGASRVEVISDSSGALDLAGEVEGIPGFGGAAEWHSQRAHASRQVVELPGSPTPKLDPADVPERFAWYQGEQEWQDLYVARLEHGLLSSEVTMVYEEQSALSASMKASLQEFGIAAGPAGNFATQAFRKLVADVNLKLGLRFKKVSKMAVAWKLQFPPPQ